MKTYLCNHNKDEPEFFIKREPSRSIDGGKGQLYWLGHRERNGDVHERRISNAAYLELKKGIKPARCVAGWEKVKSKTLITNKGK